LKKPVFLLLIVAMISVMLTGFIGVKVLASPENWQEVTSFTGSGTKAYFTGYFTCDHTEWRIRWSYVPDSSHPEYALFTFDTFPQGETVSYIDSISEGGGSNTSGISYIHNDNGTFRGKVNVANTESYTVIIEQDMDSIPEFPNSLAIILVSIVFIFSAALWRRRSSVRPNLRSKAWVLNFLLKWIS
jgi:hypothetical protein